jgi:hypothetical protein
MWCTLLLGDQSPPREVLSFYNAIPLMLVPSPGNVGLLSSPSTFQSLPGRLRGNISKGMATMSRNPVTTDNIDQMSRAQWTRANPLEPCVVVCHFGVVFSHQHNGNLEISVINHTDPSKRGIPSTRRPPTPCPPRWHPEARPPRDPHRSR